MKRPEFNTSSMGIFVVLQAQSQALLAMLCIVLSASTNASADSRISNPLLDLSATEIALAYGDERVYRISRNGKRIGTHRLSFNHNNNEFTVSVNSSITVRILKIPVYRLSYTSVETWRDNALVSVTATTTENGDSKTVALDNLQVVDGLAKTRYASNHWHPGVLTGNTVFNTLTGQSSRITVTDFGAEQLSVADGEITAIHYQYDEDIQANVWYDAEGLWLKMRFTGDDGSIITYMRE